MDNAPSSPKWRGSQDPGGPPVTAARDKGRSDQVKTVVSTSGAEHSPAEAFVGLASRLGPSPLPAMVEDSGGSDAIQEGVHEETREYPGGMYECRWDDCFERFPSGKPLGDHIRSAHIQTQNLREAGTCRLEDSLVAVAPVTPADSIPVTPLSGSPLLSANEVIEKALAVCREAQLSLTPSPTPEMVSITTKGQWQDFIAQFPPFAGHRCRPLIKDIGRHRCEFGHDPPRPCLGGIARDLVLYPFPTTHHFQGYHYYLVRAPVTPQVSSASALLKAIRPPTSQARPPTKTQGPPHAQLSAAAQAIAQSMACAFGGAQLVRPHNVPMFRHFMQAVGPLLADSWFCAGYTGSLQLDLARALVGRELDSAAMQRGFYQLIPLHPNSLQRNGNTRLALASPDAIDGRAAYNKAIIQQRDATIKDLQSRESLARSQAEYWHRQYLKVCAASGTADDLPKEPLKVTFEDIAFAKQLEARLVDSHDIATNTEEPIKGVIDAHVKIDSTDMSSSTFPGGEQSVDLPPIDHQLTSVIPARRARSCDYPELTAKRPRIECRSTADEGFAARK